MVQLTLPIWIVLWLVISTLIVCADVGFVLLRPHSMEKGIYSWFPMWNMYPLYYSIDRLYADMNNAFVIAQSHVNILECIGNVIGLITFKFVSRSSGALILLLSVTATLAKTVLYMVHEHCSPEANHPTAHNFPDNWRNYILLYMLPNSLWLIFPFLIVRNLFGQLRVAADAGTAVGSTKKSK